MTSLQLSYFQMEFGVTIYLYLFLFIIHVTEMKIESILV